MAYHHHHHQQQLAVLLLAALALLATTARAYWLLPTGRSGGLQRQQQASWPRSSPWMPAPRGGVEAQPLTRMQAGKKKQPWTPPKNEFARTIDLDDVGRKPTRMRVEANEKERAALAERFEFLNLHHLSANVSISRPRWGTLLAEGTLRASMDRNCVVTGELFPFEFTADFSTYIKEVGGAVPLYGSDEEEAEWGQGAGELEEDDYDDEVEAGGELDVGEIVAQYCYLLLPPYPTLPGKSLDDIPDEVVFELGPEDLGGQGFGGSGAGGNKKKPKPSW